jgi:hypothetical protein
VECGGSKVSDAPSGNAVSKEPTGARLLCFPDSATIVAFFQNIVKTHDLPRNDTHGACRPKKVPKTRALEVNER